MKLCLWEDVEKRGNEYECVNTAILGKILEFFEGQEEEPVKESRLG